MNSRSRRRGPWLFSEASPLELDHRSRSSSNYSTFSRSMRLESGKSVTCHAFLATVYAYLAGVQQDTRCRPKQERYALWLTICSIAVCTALGVLQELRSYPLFVAAPEWRWDHNAYSPQRSHNELGAALRSRTLLLAQTAGSDSLERLADISSRPNRAYARQWSIDYTLVTRPNTATVTRACFDMVLVVKALVDKQRYATASSRVYDTVLLLPPDAVVTNLDYDLLQLLPEDKLVAMASLDGNARRPDSRTEVVFFNLKHPLAYDVAEVWFDLIEPPLVTCGAGNSLQALVSAIQSVLDGEEGGGDVSDYVYTLEESHQGFVGRDTRVVKEILPPVPSSKAISLTNNLAESTMALQTTVDSVCYRYYPKCEVL